MLTLALLAVPLAVKGQQPGKTWRIGLLVSGPPPDEHICVLALRQGLHDLGYIEGQTYVFEIRSTQGARAEEAFPRFGAELVKLGVDLIVSVTGLGLVEAKPAMLTVPVVMAVSEHPVERRLINKQLGSPGWQHHGTGYVHRRDVLETRSDPGRDAA
jgi:putative ABC transport system substrate-binding protein